MSSFDHNNKYMILHNHKISTVFIYVYMYNKIQLIHTFKNQIS
jgi:hypothetical protein